MIGLVVVLVAASCGRPAAAPPTTAAPKPPPVPAVTATNPVITVVSEDQKSSFVVRAQESDIKVGAKGPEVSALSNVEGDIKSDGSTSTFSAPTGRVDQVAKTLDLEGGVTCKGEVKAKSPDGSQDPIPTIVQLHAATVHYDQKLDRIVAKGSVTVTTGSMTLGPVPELWAKPDLSKVATPNKFK